MRYEFCTAFDFLFKLLCICVVFCMISYWIYKYAMDEDVCLVDYRILSETNDVEGSELSLCIYDSLNITNEKEPYINVTSYVRYLRGIHYNEDMKSLTFSDISLNIDGFLISAYFKLRNGSEFTRHDLRHRVTFSGFLYEEFYQCYSLDTTGTGIDIKEVNNLLLEYKLSFYTQHIDNHMGFVVLHYPSQFLQTLHGQYFPYNDNTTKGAHFYIKINSLEILKRRNKRKDPCKEESRSFDEDARIRLFEVAGCRPPYEPSVKQFPLCETQDDIRKAMVDFSRIRREITLPPCQIMPKLDFDIGSERYLKDDVFVFNIVYLEQIKVISQSQAVNFHSLVGNIGGYIGLFLGILFIEK